MLKSANSKAREAKGKGALCFKIHIHFICHPRKPRTSKAILGEIWATDYYHWVSAGMRPLKKIILRE